MGADRLVCADHTETERIGALAVSSNPVATAHAGPGVWLSLTALRELPLDPDVRCRLLQGLALAGNSAGGSLATPLQLQLEAAEATASSGLDAQERGAWLEAVERQSELAALIAALAQQCPEQAGGLWGRYGELLAGLTAAVHGVVNSTSTNPPEALLRAELCWRLMVLLEQGRRLPFTAPDWLAVLEQQLVQDGALFWRELIGHGEATDAPERALTLLLRLSQLLEPCPTWVVEGCKGLLEAWLESRLTDGLPAPADLELLLPWLERWPVAQERQAELQTALLRLRLSLELQAQMAARQASTRSEPQPEPEREPMAPARPTPGAEQADPPGPLQLVLLQEGAACRPEWLNLAPLLTADLEELEQAMAAFLARHDHGGSALAASTGLLQSLVPLWRSGGRLPAGSFALLSYAAAAWQRRLGERIMAAPPLSGRSGLVVELERRELAVLQAVLGRDPALEPALAALRRHHHDAAFWQTEDATPWYGLLSCQEALRQLQRDLGFYASGPAPLESVRQWAQGAVAALLAAEVWCTDPSCLGPWLALAQQLNASGQAVPALGSGPEAAALLQALAGQEVVYVGEAVEAIGELHRQGRLFKPEPFGLRCVAAPASRHPQRPHGSFEQSLALLVEQLEALHQQRPFQVLLCDVGAYRLGLAQALHTHLAVRAVCTATPLAPWLAEA
jgi:hypothetical protein